MENGYQLIFRKKDSDKFWKLFNLLQLEYNYIGARYDKYFLDYYFIRALDSNYKIHDCSCIFTFNGEPFSAFLGALFSKEGIRELSLYEIPCLALDSKSLSNSKKKQINIYLNQLKSLEFYNFKVKGPDFHHKLPIICEKLLKLSSRLHNSLSKTIDLNKEEYEIKQEIRKSFHSLINWGGKELYIEVYDKKNITWDILNSFRKLHIKESQRETRSIRTWEKQFEAIQCGVAFCITAKLNDNLVSAAFFIISYNLCYYFSSASNRSLFDKPLNHAIIWKAILESKKRGALFFDIGTTYFDESDKNLSDKEKNIVYFKDGFGGNYTLNPYVLYQKH